LQFQTSWEKKICETPTSTNKNLDVVAYACHPSYTRSINSRITEQASPVRNLTHYSKKYLKPKRLRVWLKW
jgi:hypothetical protein